MDHLLWEEIKDLNDALVEANNRLAKAFLKLAEIMRKKREEVQDETDN